MSDLQSKWDRIYRTNSSEIVAMGVLSSHRFLLPKSGQALDLACGLGANALLLAEQGLDVQAWDISPVALAALRDRATLHRLSVTTHQADITPDKFKNDYFDVIVISRFLDRTLCNAIMTALKPKGLLFYQTFTRAKFDSQGPNNPDYVLDGNELLRLFAPLKLVYYQEYARIGDLQYGNRNEACFIGQKLIHNQEYDRKS